MEFHLLRRLHEVKRDNSFPFEKRLVPRPQGTWGHGIGERGEGELPAPFSNFGLSILLFLTKEQNMFLKIVSDKRN